MSCWRATPPAPRGVRAICPVAGTITLSLAPTASWVVRIGSQAFRLSAPPLIMAHQAGAAPPVPDRLSALVVPLARLPLLGPLVAAVAPSQSVLYRVRLLGPGRCDLPPAPCPQALLP